MAKDFGLIKAEASRLETRLPLDEENKKGGSLHNTHAKTSKR
jgi:hypothetical protein